MLSRAIESDDGPAVAELLRKHPAVLEARDEPRGRTPLYEAVVESKGRSVRALVEAGAAIHATQGEFWPLAATPWTAALTSDSPDLVDALVAGPGGSASDLTACAKDLFELAGRGGPRTRDWFALYAGLCKRLGIPAYPVATGNEAPAASSAVASSPAVPKPKGPRR